MSQAPRFIGRHAKLGALVFFGFVVLPLAMVALRGGSSLEVRSQQWTAWRTTMQSWDPAREAIDDPARDVPLIESFLTPSPDRRERAQAFYDEWRGNKNWWTLTLDLREIDYSEDGLSAVLRYDAKLKHKEFKLPESERRRTSRTERWEKHQGIWYLAESRDEVLEVLPPRSREAVLPEARSAR